MQVRYIGELEYRMEILGGQGGVDWWNVVKIDIILHSIQVNRCAQCQLRCNFIINVLKVFQDENESTVKARFSGEVGHRTFVR